jgi:hypothetical protein
VIVAAAVICLALVAVAAVIIEARLHPRRLRLTHAQRKVLSESSKIADEAFAWLIKQR